MWWLNNRFEFSDLKNLIADPLVEAPTSVEVEKANYKLKNHKSPGNDAIPANYKNEGTALVLALTSWLVRYGQRKKYHKIGRKRDNSHTGDKMVCQTTEVYRSSTMDTIIMLENFEDQIGDYQCGFRKSIDNTPDFQYRTATGAMLGIQ